MKPFAAVLSLLGLVGCFPVSFPEYDSNDGSPEPISTQPNCADGKRNGDETGLDCGMVGCSLACPPGQGCAGDQDCAGGRCLDAVCREPSCNDGLKNGAETDSDCGGDQGCERCTTGQRCGGVDDCDGGSCGNGQCRAPSCKDGLQNANESDVDCGGGECGPCGENASCVTSDDCDMLACKKGQCLSAACADGVLNRDETDLDCGGSCDPCADNAKCQVAADCASGVCPNKTLRCAVPTCTDGFANGSEPAVDCGASCPDKCQLLDACSNADDCATESCVSALCLPSAATGQKLSTLGWLASASNTFPNSSPQNAIDGVNGTDWTTGATQVPGLWFTIDMQEAQVFFSLEIDCTNTRDDSAAALDISLSNDGNFTDRVKTNIPGEDNMVITFAKPQVARYIKFSLAQGTDHWWRMDEIRVKQ